MPDPNKRYIRNVEKKSTECKNIYFLYIFSAIKVSRLPTNNKKTKKKMVDACKYRWIVIGNKCSPKDIYNGKAIIMFATATL